MKFDERYEHIQVGFRDNKEGIIRGLNPGYCSQCKRSRKYIYWLDMKSGKHVCSEECLEKLRNPFYK